MCQASQAAASEVAGSSTIPIAELELVMALPFCFEFKCIIEPLVYQN